MERRRMMELDQFEILFKFSVIALNESSHPENGTV